MDIYFLNPAASETTRSQYVLDVILSIVQNTPELLRIAVAYFTHPDIAQALINRAKCGRPTRLLLNAADLVRPVLPQEGDFIVSQHLIDVVQYGHPMSVRALGAGVAIDHWVMHHKFIVAQHQVLFGSLNWTISAFTSNFEAIATSTESHIIDGFIKEHDRLWSHAAVLRSTGIQLHIVKCPHCQSTEGIDFQSWGPMCTKCGKRFKLLTVEAVTSKTAG